MSIGGACPAKPPPPPVRPTRPRARGGGGRRRRRGRRRRPRGSQRAGSAGGGRATRPIRRGGGNAFLGARGKRIRKRPMGKVVGQQNAGCVVRGPGGGAQRNRSAPQATTHPSPRRFRGEA